MRVLLWMIDGNIIPGGHRVQLDQTARFLRELGVDAQICYEAEAQVADFDIVHSFGLPPIWLRRCRQAKVPVVISPIYNSRTYTTGQDRTHTTKIEGARKLAGRMRQGASLWREALRGRASEACEKKNARLTFFRVTYEMADLLLPNSELEAQCLFNDLGVTTPYHVVPNAVDAARFSLPEKENQRDYALFAGRLEPHKNQLGLIRAWNGELPPLKIVGKAHPHHEDYYQKCGQEARAKNIEILPGVPHDELPALYHGAKIHVLPTWYETTGLVSLEAALCGANIVTTNRGFAREYFQDFAWYCDPAQPETIRSAVKEAWQSPFQAQLRQRILDNYTWEHTARATLEGYRLVLENNFQSSSSFENRQR